MPWFCWLFVGFGFAITQPDLLCSILSWWVDWNLQQEIRLPLPDPALQPCLSFGFNFITISRIVILWENLTEILQKNSLKKLFNQISFCFYYLTFTPIYYFQPKPLVPHVRTEANRFGSNTSNNNPYLAFRRRTEKMQTRKNRKNDEASYEKMIKLKRDLGRVLQLLELVKQREFIKKELLKLTIQQYEKRWYNYFLFIFYYSKHII